jgi:hypothetical protein
MHPLVVVVQVVLRLSSAWYIPYLGVSYADHHSSRIGAIAHSINHGSSSYSSNNHSSRNSSSTVLHLNPCSSLPSGHHSSLPPATFHASTAGRCGTLPVNAANPSKTARHKLRHPWSASKGARGVLHHRLVVPATPSWMRSPWEKKC